MKEYIRIHLRLDPDREADMRFLELYRAQRHKAEWIVETCLNGDQTTATATATIHTAETRSEAKTEYLPHNAGGDEEVEENAMAVMDDFW